MDSNDIWRIAITAILTTVGTLLVTRFNHVLASAKDSNVREDERNRNALYLAVRTVSVLDPFVSKCCDVVADEGRYDPEDGGLYTTVDTPKLEFPENVDWRSVKPDLMYRILTLPNEIDHALRSISFVGSEIATPPDYEEFYDERRYQYGKLGLMALDLAADIRSTYGLQSPDYSRWDPRPTLEGAFVKEDEIRAKISTL